MLNNTVLSMSNLTTSRTKKIGILNGHQFTASKRGKYGRIEILIDGKYFIDIYDGVADTEDIRVVVYAGVRKVFTNNPVEPIDVI